MATLGTQNISTSYPQLFKVLGNTPMSTTLVAVATGDESATSALQLSTTGVKSTGTFAVDGASLLSGAVTFSTSFTASSGTATIGTLSASTATISTATISTATIPNMLGAITFGSSLTASTGTATIGTATISTATISTASIPNIRGAVTFGSTITASTGTNTFGTNSVNYETVSTLQLGPSGPKITNFSYGTAAFTSATAAQYNGASTTTGTFGLTGCALGDIVIGSLDSIGSATGTTLLTLSFYPQATNVVRYAIGNQGSTAGTIPAGTFYATAIRLTA